ncbi:Hypothetical predicted protein [Lecanosticta acicola]|uniref:SnoaL-like domain-containing protein n=1 Tax=Lecanosticta acicola TaxID=111012 RepID=A0AAI8YTM8_9PEZI|nr:Hypothetical predicted protein [Lecanosticta acicola]
MQSFALILGFLACLALATPADDEPQKPLSSTYDDIIQAGYKTAYLLDSKNYTALGEVMTEDVVYDSSPLGPSYGGKSVGLENVQKAVKAAFGDADTEHVVTNLYIKEMISSIKTNVITYITYSRWDKDAHHDIKKTFRIWYKCDDIWVLQDGAWKMKYSLVRNMAPRVEAPSFGGGN